MNESRILVCPLWAERNESLECRLITCAECKQDVSIYAPNAQFIAEGWTPLCLGCFVKRAIAAASAGEPVQLVSDREAREALR